MQDTGDASCKGIDLNRNYGYEWGEQNITHYVLGTNCLSHLPIGVFNVTMHPTLDLVWFLQFLFKAGMVLRVTRVKELTAELPRTMGWS